MMRKHRTPHPVESREHIEARVNVGRTSEDSREFEPTAQTIIN